VRAEHALTVRGIPFSYIDIAQHPERRQDMISLANGVCTVPQVFFNDQHVGGADDLIKLVQALENGKTGVTGKKSDDIHAQWAQKVHQAPDPKDPRLAPPSDLPESIPEYGSELPLKSIALPDGTFMTVVDLLPRLERILQPHHRAYNAHWYKNCFVNTDAVVAVQREFGIDATVATKFLQQLQQDWGLLHHVCADHIFRNDGYLFFRLSHHQEPHILNSSIEWKRLVVTTNSVAHYFTQNYIDTIDGLQRRLHQILVRYADHNGLTDYVNVAQDPDLFAFEVASCVLQGKQRFRRLLGWCDSSFLHT
jgi:glutaredoxin 3